MRAKGRRIPRATHHKGSGQAVVRLDGKDYYLGRFGSDQAQAAYHRLVGEWLAGQRPAGGETVTTVAQLAAAYVTYAVGEYRKNGRATSEVGAIKAAVRFVVADAELAETPVEHFGPLKLKQARRAMVAAGLARHTVNAQAKRLRAMFAWGGENELIDGVIAERLRCVKGLRKGKGGRETRKRRPVARQAVEAVRPMVSRQVWAMIELQWHTGMRPGEVGAMTTAAIDTTGEVWEYCLTEHKTDADEEERIVQIGPEGQAILRPWLRVALDEPLFQPIEAEAERLAERRAARKTPVWPSHAKRYARQKRRRPRRKPGTVYTVAAYRRAIRRACDELEIDHWTPHQLRHSFATRVRKQFGLDAARAALGHAGADVTLDYAELDRRAAAKVAKRIG